MVTADIAKYIEHCELCPRKCGANRLIGNTGPCGAGSQARLASAVIHKGEEPPISGIRGSATFFFSHCPLSCVFCQNFPISQLGHGKDVTVEYIAERMCRLASRGAHNINIVTGTQFAPHIVAAVREARKIGLTVPVVWNTSGYETQDTIDLLKNTVDIYLTDVKYADNKVAKELSDADNYFEISLDAARRMLDQVGYLQVNDEGIGIKGIIVRHLVLPQNLSQTAEVMSAIRDQLGAEISVSLMGQYFPAFRAKEIPCLSRSITHEEYDNAEQAVLNSGLEEGWFQNMENPEGSRGA